ncbi:nitrate- and nitrite sensing domain-containing protein [Streptomyces sp. NBC_01754]|uniref:nitrate- and nitrite sensing domain-containing protein n=1 Tax=Streptomyces sp. NBC_01754 TaxID=2975930 RepID=UPI002DDA7EB6|nr:nitrate- and nitrite sensing domain-containing protein [Streptomyces sp. NBC_01754]WSC95472.1 nitrate- and nitrite sensing domain-containing protein [Streptomyces sp. NBC_01754]
MAGPIVKEHPLRTRASRRTDSTHMSLRTALLVLAVVPGVALAALWAVTSGQTLLDFQRQAAQGLLAAQAGQPSNIVYYNLQEERRLSAEALSRPDASRTALEQQRARTDEAVDTFQSLSDVSADDAPAEVRDAVGRAREAMNQLPAQRTLVDEGDGRQQKAVYAYYTDLIAVDLQLFAALSHVDNGEITQLGQPLVDLFWAKEMISRSDAVLARGWAAGRLSTEDLQEVREAVSGQAFQTGTKVVPYLPENEQDQWRELTEGSAWAAKTEIEKRVLGPVAADRSGFVELDADETAWREAMDAVTPRLVDLLEQRTDAVVATGKDSVMSLLVKMVLTSVIGLVAVVVVAWTTWRLTRTLRRRVLGLQERAEELEKALPDVIERLAQGEKIDVEAEARAIDAPGEGGDELTRLGGALNQARTSALEAAVRQADQHRGFERLLQRIARRTQQLIGQQLKKLDELERKHEDPEILDGLFDLDHLTARLRRYEENLVILSGGSPHRRWRKPVPLLDVMRAAQGEVQDYRRVVLDLDSDPWLSERAVGPVSHVLAELIENALSFSRPPSPVEVRAAKVSRGLAVEVEDRGLGMDEEQLAHANELMSRPPRMDVLAHAEDIRLGLYVIARLADQHGLRVEFRPSAFGGTRVVVLIPDELTVPGPRSGPVAVAAVPDAPAPSAPELAPDDPSEPLPARVRGRAPAGVTTLADHPARSDRPAGHLGGPERHVPSAGPADGPGTPYGTPDQPPYGAFADPYPAGSGRPFPDAEQPGPVSGHPYTGPEEPYGTAGEPFTGHPYPVTGERHPAPDQTYGPYPPAGGAPRPHDDVPGHEPAPRPPAAPVPAAGPEAAATGTADRPSPAVTGGEPPLPRRVRQASLVDELRVGPTSRNSPPKPPSWDENPLLRPAPRRAGAAIGAFQRRSRAARAAAEPPRPPDHPTPPSS